MAKYAGRDLILKAGARQSVQSTTAASDLITATANHGLAANDRVVFTSLTGGTGLTANREYYVISTGLTATAFKVSLTQGGAAVDITVDYTAGTFFEATTIAAVQSIGSVGSSRDLIDASAYGDAFKDYVVGQQDGAELELSVVYDPADTSHVLLKTLYDAGNVCEMLVTHATATSFKVGFPALLTKLERGAEREGLLSMALSAKVLNPGVVDVT